MKIKIESEFGKCEINEQLELTGNFPLEVLDVVDDVRNKTLQQKKIVFLFYELEKLEEIKMIPDDELSEILTPDENDPESPLIY